MKDNNLNIICKKDYELYKISVPLFLRYKKRRALLTGELEKRHPCFSERFCYDAKYRIGKNGCFAYVAVMDKIKLEHYRNTTLGKHLVLEDNERLNFFCNIRKQLFISLIILLLSTVALYLCINHKNVTLEDKTEIKCENDNNLFVENKETPLDILNTIINIVNANGGEITSIEYENCYPNSFLYMLRFEIFGCFPEHFLFNKNIVISPVTYKNNKPFFSICINDEYPVSFESFSYVLTDLCDLRKTIIEIGGSIQNENIEQHQITFEIYRNNINQFITSLVSSSKNDLCINNISLYVEQETIKFCLQQTSLDNNKDFDKDSLTISNFNNQNKLLTLNQFLTSTKEIIYLKKITTLPKQLINEQQNLELIGKIDSLNGEVIFYRENKEKMLEVKK